MALTPSDVEQKTFSTALRGYDLDEVDDFLDEVVASLRDLQDQLAEAKSSAPATTEVETTPVPTPVPVDESAVGRALVAAQETADQIVAEAKTEGERIREEAKADAGSWAAERDAKKAQAEAEMEELSRHVAQVRNQLALLATAVADRLDEMDDAIESDAGTDGEAGGEESSDDEQDDGAAVADDSEDVTGEDADETADETSGASGDSVGKHKPEVYVIGSGVDHGNDQDE